MTYTRVYKMVVECVLFATAALIVIGPNVRPAQAQIGLPLPLSCVWPFETTPTTLNVMYPDSNAIYWTTPYILLAGSQLEINGSFFKARFLSLDTYTTLGDSISAIYDTQFPLDNGSQNPFSNPAVSNGSFHATIVPQPASGGTPPAGILYGPPINQFGFSQGYVIIRAYIPAAGMKESELPNITVSLNGFKLKTLSPCTTLQPSVRLLIFNALVRYWDGKFLAPGQTEPTEPMFRPPPAANANGAFPNDFNKYVVTGLTYQSGRIAVIRGKGATIPQTGPNGYPLLLDEQLRYWSMCNYDQVFPFPVVKSGNNYGCAADYLTGLDTNGFYTYIVAAPQDTPSNALSDNTVTILPWGNTRLQKALIFRNMLPNQSFVRTTQTANMHCASESLTVKESAACTRLIMGPYYPESTYCDKSVYEQGGWQACFQNKQP
jgi:hypothetical protein